MTGNSRLEVRNVIDQLRANGYESPAQLVEQLARNVEQIGERRAWFLLKAIAGGARVHG